MLCKFFQIYDPVVNVWIFVCYTLHFTWEVYMQLCKTFWNFTALILFFNFLQGWFYNLKFHTRWHCLQKRTGFRCGSNVNGKTKSSLLFNFSYNHRTFLVLRYTCRAVLTWRYSCFGVYSRILMKISGASWYTNITLHFAGSHLRVSDCCLTPMKQFFSYIMARTS
jgi:hypothetical protein